MDKSAVKLEVTPLHTIEEATEKKCSPWKLYLLTILGLLCVVILNTVPAVKEDLFKLGSTINSIGWVGPLILILIDGLIIIPLGIPSLVFEMIVALLIKNYFSAVCLSLSAKILGATVSFVLTKYVLKEKIRNLFDSLKAFKCMEHALNKSPFKFSLILRITVLPLFVKNYGLAVPKNVTFGLYILCVFITTVPVTAINMYLIRKAGDVANLLHQHHSPSEILGSLFMITLSICLFIYTARYTKKVLKELEEEEDKTQIPEEAKAEQEPAYRAQTDLDCLSTEVKEFDENKLNEAVIIEVPQQIQTVELAA